jgi:hypothetical protein
MQARVPGGNEEATLSIFWSVQSHVFLVCKDNWLSYYIIHLDTSILHQNGTWQTWCIVPKDSFKIVSQFGQFIGSRSPPWSHRSPDLRSESQAQVPFLKDSMSRLVTLTFTTKVPKGVISTHSHTRSQVGSFDMMWTLWTIWGFWPCNFDLSLHFCCEILQ